MTSREVTFRGALHQPCRIDRSDEKSLTTFAARMRPDKSASVPFCPSAVFRGLRRS